jgi:hypothetical protein
VIELGTYNVSVCGVTNGSLPVDKRPSAACMV